MSSSAQPAGPARNAGKERRGIARVFSKVKDVWKKGDLTSKRQSAPPITASVAPTAETTAAPTEVPTTAAPAAVTTPEVKAEVALENVPTAHSRALEARARYEGMRGVTKFPKSQLLEERAMKLNRQFGLEIRPSEWALTVSNDTVLRMDKPIRMRVRRTCLSCKATFGASKECPNCQHRQSTRYPPKRTEAEIIASRGRRAAIIKANRENAPIIPDYGWGEREIVLKRPSKTGGQDLIHKKPRQRVRRTCHECDTLFHSRNKTCERCSHVRCTDCPRDPPKKDKYPLGYPGDEFGPNSIPHYECVKCMTIYPTNAKNGTECGKCQNPKSDASPRARPRKVEVLPDPEVLKQIQAKLDKLKIT